MLTPHPRSLLFGITECFRVEEEEEALLPAWQREEAVETAGFQPTNAFEAGLIARHATRSQSQSNFARIYAERELPELLGVRSIAEVPGRLLDRYAQVLDHSLRHDARNTEFRQREVESGKRRDSETIARVALRPRVVLGLVGLYIGRGKGDMTATATIARQGVPTADDDGKAQRWHVRDALRNYLHPVLNTSEPLTDVRVMGLAFRAVTRVEAAIRTLDRFKVEPGYKPSRHADHLSRVAQSGALSAWLLNEYECGGDENIERAELNLRRSLVCQQYERLRETSKRRGIYVPPLKSSRRKAIAATAT